MVGEIIEFIQCDRIEYSQGKNGDIEARCWLKNEDPQCRYFEEAYLMENGKTVEHLIANSSLVIPQ